MFYRLRRTISEKLFQRACKGVYQTPPVASGKDPVRVLSMVRHEDMVLYLLAIKSFIRNLGMSPEIVILDDGTLTPEDYAALKTHVPGVRMMRFSDVPPARCPKDNCWERLLLVCDLSQDRYLIQLDSDTLTMKAVEEVARCAKSNISFTLLGDEAHPEIEVMTRAAARRKGNTSDHVQAICERSLDQLEQASTLKYVRGNAGFTGFARGSINRGQIEFYSDLMRQLSGAKWDTWGADQVASNLLIANTENAYLLPFPKYLSFYKRPGVPYDDAAYVHVIGPCRYDDGFYARLGRKTIETLMRG